MTLETEQFAELIAAQRRVKELEDENERLKIRVQNPKLSRYSSERMERCEKTIKSLEAELSRMREALEEAKTALGRVTRDAERDGDHHSYTKRILGRIAEILEKKK